MTAPDIQLSKLLAPKAPESDTHKDDEPRYRCQDRYCRGQQLSLQRIDPFEDFGKLLRIDDQNGCFHYLAYSRLGSGNPLPPQPKAVADHDYPRMGSTIVMAI